MLQPAPASHHQRHFPRPPEKDGVPAEGEIPVIATEALEQCAAFQRLLASPDFAAALRYLDATTLAALAACSDDGRKLREARARWKMAGEIRGELASYVRGIEDAMQVRKERIAASQKGEAPPPGD